MRTVPAYGSHRPSHSYRCRHQRNPCLQHFLWIRDVVREEMDCRQLPSSVPIQPACDSTVQSIIRREVAAAMCYTPPVNPSCAGLLSQELSPGDHACHGTVAPVAHVAVIFDSPLSQNTHAPRGIAADVPACYYCGIRGPISLFCRKKERDLHLYGTRGRFANSTLRRD